MDLSNLSLWEWGRVVACCLSAWLAVAFPVGIVLGKHLKPRPSDLVVQMYSLPKEDSND